MKVKVAVGEIKIEGSLDGKTPIAPVGWSHPTNSKKWHYFLEGDGKSLCCKWFYLGHRESGNDESPDNCADCRKKLTARKKLSVTAKTDVR